MQHILLYNNTIYNYYIIVTITYANFLFLNPTQGKIKVSRDFFSALGSEIQAIDANVTRFLFSIRAIVSAWGYLVKINSCHLFRKCV